MTGTPSLVAALALGLLASLHCSVMCGGVAGALALGTAPGARRWPLLIGYQAGRLASYALAGASLAGAGALLVRGLDAPALRLALRLLSAGVIAVAGLSLLGLAAQPGARWGARVWARLAPLARRFLPVRHPGQALALGLVWGWMPCGFVYTVLLLAWLSMDPLRSAAIMLAFGLGTVPALLVLQWRAQALRRALAAAGPQRWRRAGGALLLGLAALQAAAPLLAPHLAAGLHAWLPFDCGPLR